MKKNYHLLHGFLGNESFFTKTISDLKNSPGTNEVYTYNLFSNEVDKSISPENDLSTWAKNFNSIVKNNSGNNTLIAYSMGGRIGLHAYMQQPSLWQQCYFLSTNPGIIKSSQKMVRMAWEDGWCYQIDNKPWQELLKLWNAQDLFKHCAPHSPLEKDFNKNYLKLALKNWSLTKHKIDLQKINDNKLQWLVGEMDQKYNIIHHKMAEVYDVDNIRSVKGLGHRINSI